MWIGFNSSAQSARVKGIILDNENHPVADVNITLGDKAAKSNAKGHFDIFVPSNKKGSSGFYTYFFENGDVNGELKTLRNICF